MWLSTLDAGRFEPNGFMMGVKQMEVKFMPFGEPGPADVATLRASIRVEHLGGHLINRGTEMQSAASALDTPVEVAL